MRLIVFTGNNCTSGNRSFHTVKYKENSRVFGVGDSKGCFKLDGNAFGVEKTIREKAETEAESSKENDATGTQASEGVETSAFWTLMIALYLLM